MINRRTFLSLLPVSVTALAIAANVAQAQDKSAQGKEAEKARRKQAQQEAFAAMQRGEILPLTKILAIALASVPGDAVEVEFRGGPIYEVKVLTATGRLREVVLDARSGTVIRIEDE
ncbi:MAG: PepSY domain-containing protein [Proteobacteria bacterium]|uniref:PepSY domain-containing protein n=1 Tax=Rudaea sp. TaxID=2136325 RepID=UPI00322047FF|nr:PepSY domain-containing protein [Pseudomonadota bacterium]